MVKAAIARGVYIEITYSNFIKDIQVRRQMIPNAKLLVEWTRGRNLIVSSACASVNELRGPYDVANLASLFGISMEHAKASVSRNCRDLIANALRKRKFYKEAIRVEPMALSEKSDSEAQWSIDSLKWDPISSGDGDLLLDDLSKSFSVSNNLTKTVKAINFDSIIDCVSSHQFQVKDLISGTGTASVTSNAKNLVSNAEKVDLSDTIDNAATCGSLEGRSAPDMDSTLSFIAPLKHPTTGHNIFAEAVPVGRDNDAKEDGLRDDAVRDDEDEFIPLDIPNQAVLNDFGSKKSAPEDGFKMTPLQEDMVCEIQRANMESVPTHSSDATMVHFVTSDIADVSSVLKIEEHKHSDISILHTNVKSHDLESHARSLDLHDALTDGQMSMDTILSQRMTESEQIADPGDIAGFTADEKTSEDDVSIIGNNLPMKDVLIKEVAVEDWTSRIESSLVAEGTSVLEYDDVVKVNNDSLYVKQKQPEEVIMEDQDLVNKAILLNDGTVADSNDAEIKVNDGYLTREHEEMVGVASEDQKQDAEIFTPTFNLSMSESRGKQRKRYRAFSLPFKRLLSPPFKKKAQRR